ncbi:MAG: DUF2892 domain-containing protein [Candidatus Ancaeobacter aquaticus]|nr:DUF2892 domain-containing protein [Candidatus Ancaeobacter aquaticus]
MIERLLRGISGGLILISLALAYFVSIWWLLFTAFIGVNLLQSAFTNWCPMITILKKLGMR